MLARNQGKGGLPEGPAANPKLARDGQAQVDLDAALALASQQQAARNETEAQGEAVFHGPEHRAKAALCK